MFSRINISPSLLNNMEVRKGTLRGKFIDFIYNECAKIPLFLESCPIPSFSRDRQLHQELILRFFAFYENYPIYRSNGLARLLDFYVE